MASVEIYDGESRTSEWWEIIHSGIAAIFSVFLTGCIFACMIDWHDNLSAEVSSKNLPPSFTNLIAQDQGFRVFALPFTSLLKFNLSLSGQTNLRDYFQSSERFKKIEELQKSGHSSFIAASLIELGLILAFSYCFVLIFHRWAFALFYYAWTIWFIATLISGFALWLLGIPWSWSIFVGFFVVIIKTLIIYHGRWRVTSWG